MSTIDGFDEVVQGLPGRLVSDEVLGARISFLR